jgi:hypothetical protein
MPQRHLFPCPHCDQAFPIDTTQAGQNLICPKCTESSSAPTLRKIRELPIDETQAVEKAAGWSFERRSMFAVGLAAFLVGLGITTVFLLLRSQLNTDIPAIPEEEAFIAIVEDTPIDGLWVKWKESVRDTDLGDWTPSPITMARKQAKLYLQVSIITTIIALSGLGMSIFSVVRPERSKQAA